MATRILTLILFLSTGMIGQIVVSSCTAPDSIIQKYAESSWYIAWEDRGYVGYFDSVNVSTAAKDKILNAIIAVYNTTGHERDSVFVFRDITSYINTSMRKLILVCDTSELWGKELSLGNLNTGFLKLDSMIDLYRFDSVHESFIYPNRRWFTLYSDSFYNMIALSLQFDSLYGVLASPYNFIGDGNDIYDSVGVNTIDLAFSYGWNDCEVSCINRKFWRYRVFTDCSVEYLGTFQTPYLSIETPLIEDKIQIFPIPSTSLIYFINAEDLSSFSIYDVTGNFIREEKALKNMVDYNISDLRNGIYFIQLHTTEGIVTKKIIKI